MDQGIVRTLGFAGAFDFGSELDREADTEKTVRTETLAEEGNRSYGTVMSSEGKTC